MKSIVSGLCLMFALNATCNAAPIEAARAVATKPMAVAATNMNALSSSQWQLISARSAAGQPIIALEAPISGANGQVQPPLTLSFSNAPGEPARMVVTNACNTMSGPVATKGLKDPFLLQIGPMISTKMACSPALTNRERVAGRLLSGSLNASIAKQDSNLTTLTLKTPQGAVLKFKSNPTNESVYGAATRMFLEVAPQTKSCHGVMPMTCLYVRPIEFDANGIKTKVGEWSYFYDEIKGYTHQNGTGAVLRIDRYDVKPPVPADASRYFYVLDMVVESSR